MVRIPALFLVGTATSHRPNVLYNDRTGKCVMCGNGLEKAVTFDLLITRNPSAVFFEGAHI